MRYGIVKTNHCPLTISKRCYDVVMHPIFDTKTGNRIYCKAYPKDYPGSIKVYGAVLIMEKDGKRLGADMRGNTMDAWNVIKGYAEQGRITKEQEKFLLAEADRLYDEANPPT